MARADTVTLLPLYSWAKIMGISPWDLNQIGEGFPVKNSAQCNHVFFQSAWQQDYLCREELATTIYMAEQMVAEQLGYWPAPKYFVNETHPYPHNRVSGRMGITPYGLWKAIVLNNGKVQGGGLFTRTLINNNVAVVLSDSDGDSINDKFTATVATAVTDPDEIAVYFKSANRGGDPVSEAWRIRPIRVTISGGNATIEGHSSLLVDPMLTTVTDPVILNVTTAANYVTNVEVHRVHRDTTTTAANPAQGTVAWEESGCTNPPCSVSLLPMCLGARDAEMGMVSIDYYLDGQNVPFVCEPDRVSVNYLAGHPLDNGQMDKTMADIVAHLATGLLAVGSCGCDRSDRIIAWWRGFPSDGKENNRPISLREIDNNPFGQSRGALWAWQRVRVLMQMVAGHQ